MNKLLEAGNWVREGGSVDGGIEIPNVEKHHALREQRLAESKAATEERRSKQVAVARTRELAASERERVRKEREAALDFNFADMTRGISSLKADVDYQNLPDGYIPEGMARMADSRLHRTASHGYDPSKRTNADRRNARLSAMKQQARAQAAKEVALKRLEYLDAGTLAVPIVRCVPAWSIAFHI